MSLFLLPALSVLLELDLEADLVLANGLCTASSEAEAAVAASSGLLVEAVLFWARLYSGMPMNLGTSCLELHFVDCVDDELVGSR